MRFQIVMRNYNRFSIPIIHAKKALPIFVLSKKFEPTVNARVTSFLFIA